MKMRRLMVGVAALVGGLASQAALAQSTVFAIDVRAAVNQLISFPLNAPAYNIIAPVAEDFFAIDFNEDGSVLYGITFVAAPGAGHGRFGTINTTTGVFTEIATITGATQANWGDLSFDPTTDTMYAMGGNTLYTINLATAAVTLVAPITGGPAAPLYIDLAIDNAGNMFGHDIVTDVMVSINKATGVATTLGPTGLLANFAQGMDFDPATNVLYATLYVGTGVGSFVSINTTTGAATVIVSTQTWTPNGAEMEMAIKPVAPPACYPDCNQSGTLTLADFGCFQGKYVLGDMYADCNNSGTLSLADFGCFQSAYVLGCP